MAGVLDGKVALVTGGASGIGKASCEALAAAGAAVVVADLHEDAAASVAAGIEAAGGRASAVAVDVSSAAQCEAMVASAVDAFGALHVVHANAGIAGMEVDGPTATLTPEQWDRLIAINLSGVFYTCHFALPALEAAGGGSIITTASSMSTTPLGLTDAYAAAKGGVAMLTKSMCLTAGAKGIRVNAIGPGYVDTPMNSMIWAADAVRDGFAQGHATGLQTPEEIADVVVFLASDASRSLTGALITCDRGWTAFKAPEVVRGLAG
ncbi:MAG: SDR family NAD(P)-dependent oxidoreductase [Acidimicrobiales bacterium]